MAYSRGNSNQIIVGAAAFFVAPTTLDPDSVEEFDTSESFKDTLQVLDDEDSATPAVNYRNIGYTSNGLELTFQPDFGSVNVDQILDVAKLYKQGMQVTMKTAFAEATLENLLIALAMPGSNLTNSGKTLDLVGGKIGECPVERGLVAIGPGSGDCATSDTAERVYTAYRALSIDNVTVSAKRDAPSMFEVSFRLLPEDTSGSYGKIVDRTWTTS
jgi:hypothetical protein